MVWFILFDVCAKAPTPNQYNFCTQNTDINTVMSTKFVQQLCERLKWAYKTTQNIIENENQRHKQNYELWT